MFPELLYTTCKNYIGDDRSVIPYRHYCKAFPNGDGIPRGYKCRILVNFQVLDKKAEKPKNCLNGIGFEFKDNYRDPRVVMEEARQRGEDWPEE